MNSLQSRYNLAKGFSLVELSIVLVILGLLVGGVLSGQSLIRAAELRTAIRDTQRFIAATQTFRDKYFAIPGDMSNATAFWGTLGGNASDNYTLSCGNTSPAVPNGNTTCNGDGDGSTLLFSGATAYSYERFRFWQHLSSAGLIEGSYTGCNNTSCGSAATGAMYPGINAPQSKVNSGTFFAVTQLVNAGATSCCGYYNGTTSQFAGDHGKNMVWITNGSAASDQQAFRPEEAWNIDTKMDDSIPGTGRVIASKGDGTNTFCTDKAGVAAGSDGGAVYRFDIKVRDCQLRFTNAF